MKPADVYFILAQGAELTSAGMAQLAEDVRSWPDVRVTVFHWDQWTAAVAVINDRAKADRVRLGVGYSLGANALTWILGGAAYEGQLVPGMHSSIFDAAVFIDPTWLSIMTPLSPTKIKSALHFHNVSLDPVGHADVPRAPDFPTWAYKRVEVYGSHFTIDLDKDVQKQTLDFLVGARS